MAHIPLEKLAQKLADAGREVEVGARYVHYKDPAKEYVIKSFAILEATDEVGVIYEAQYDKRISFIRLLTNFCGSVDVAGVSTPRFTKAN
ncbi:MAG: DUF1653 domain-containing protein [Patescibacteria group bacterium]